MFYIDNKNMTCIKTQNCQIMTTIAYRILKFETTIKKPIVANHTFFTSITVNGISSVAYINSVRQNTVFYYLIFKKILIKIIYNLFAGK